MGLLLEIGSTKQTHTQGVKKNTKTAGTPAVEGATLWRNYNQLESKHLKEERKAADLATEIEKLLNKSQTFDGLAALVFKEWVEVMYKCTTFARKSILKACDMRAEVIIQDCEEKR